MPGLCRRRQDGRQSWLRVEPSKIDEKDTVWSRLSRLIRR